MSAKGPLDKDNQIFQGIKLDSGKPPMGLLPMAALRSVSEVLAFGARKYGAHNWRRGLLWSRLYDAALRHLSAWIEGEDKDTETGLSHLAHASCCLLFLLSYELTGTGLDDRWKGEDNSNK